MRSKFVYSCSIKIHASGFHKLLEGIFLLPAGCGSIFSATSCQDALRGGSWLARDQVNMVDKAKRYIAQFIQLLKHWMCNVWSWRRTGAPLLTKAATGIAVFGGSH